MDYLLFRRQSESSFIPRLTDPPQADRGHSSFTPWKLEQNERTNFERFVLFLYTLGCRDMNSYFFFQKMTPIAELLLKHTAVRVSLDPPFEWTSGIVSPVYCDNRLMTGFTEPRQQIVSALVQKIRSSNLKPEVIAGTATAAISWAAFVAAELDLPMVYIRPEPKKHGSKKQIEGYLAVNSKVVLIEDLISTAGSSVKSAAALRDEGQSAVLGIVSIMNWELPQAEAALRAANLE